MFTNKAQSRRRLARAQASGQRLFESLERRDLFAGSISGNVYVDRNGSLAHDTGDAGYAGFPGPSATVYIDSNNNGTFDTGELGTVPDGLGNYSFNNLLNGVYVVRLVKPTGFINMARRTARPPRT
jgi:hypothetical protein